MADIREFANRDAYREATGEEAWVDVDFGRARTTCVVPCTHPCPDRDRYAELMWQLSDIAHNTSLSVPLGMRAEDHYRDQLRRCIAIAARALNEADTEVHE